MRPRVTLQLPAPALFRAASLPPPLPNALHGARVLLVGEGYVAKALRPRLAALGAQVSATQRDGEWALTGPRARAAFERASHVVVSVPPARTGNGPGMHADPALHALAGAGAEAATDARWIGYLSATSVYGDRGGQWCFEGEAPTPGLPRGVRRANAEIAWLEAFPQTQLFRLAGIYGPGRSPFMALRAHTARVVDAPGHLVNRIHVEDIVSALLLSMAQPSPGDIYNVADGHPAAPGEVLDHAARLLGVRPAPRVSLDDPSVSAMARSFYRETKRVSAQRLRERLGWRPEFPSFQTGLAAVLAADTAP